MLPDEPEDLESEAETIGASTAAETLVVQKEEAGMRLDVFINGRMKLHSRNSIKDLIKNGSVLVNGETVKPSLRCREGDEVVIEEFVLAREYLKPEPIPLHVLFEDASVLVINKPPRLAVHPGAGRKEGTLANALAYHFEQLSDIGGPLRPGIVHRLDRDTSGVMVVAKTNTSHFALGTQFQDRTTEKIYHALVEGDMEFDEDVVDRPIGRHRTEPAKMAIDPDGKPAFTRFEVLQRFRGFTYVRCFPKSGRTHQIRVHLASAGHPILCDPLYGRRSRFRIADLVAAPDAKNGDRVILDRQALHAFSLSFYHPLRGERLTFEAPLPDDFGTTLLLLHQHRSVSPPRLRSRAAAPEPLEPGWEG